MQHATLYLEAPHTPPNHKARAQRSPLNYSPLSRKPAPRPYPRSPSNNILNASSPALHEFDMVNRVSQTFAQQATNAGRRALATTAIYKASPLLPHRAQSFSLPAPPPH